MTDTMMVGRRYSCDSCGTAVLCVNPGQGRAECCDRPLSDLVLEDVPSGD